MARLLTAVLLAIGPVVAEKSENSWTGRVKLSATPEAVAGMLASEDRAVRAKVARLFQPPWADWSTEPRRFHVTYWQLDEDAYREAILESGAGFSVGYLVLDQDAEGWWFVGRYGVFARGSPSGFRVRNWPDEQGPRSVIFEGAAGWGTGVFVQGISVYRLSKGRLTRVIESDLWGELGVMGGVGPSEHRYTRSFLREEPHRILVAHREIRRSEPFEHGAPLSAFRAAKVASCVEHLPSGTKRELPVSECAQVSAAMRGID